MARLATALGAGATSDTFEVSHGSFGLLLSGTFNTTTLTMQVSADGSTWQTFSEVHGDDLTDFTFASPQAKVFYFPGFRFRFVTNSTGTPPSINIDVIGPGVGI